MEEVVLRTEGLSQALSAASMPSENANFELRMGEHVAIMGDNGAGEYDLCPRQITGVEQRTGGKIIFRRPGSALQGPA